MKKYLISFIVIIIISSIILNIYFYIKIKDYNQQQDAQYNTTVNHLYGQIYEVNLYLDKILEEDSSREPSDIVLVKYFTRIDNAIARAHELATDLGRYKESNTEIERLIAYLFAIYFEDEVNQLEVTLHENNREEFMKKASKINAEIRVIMDSLPDSDQVFTKLSEQEKVKTWIDIVKQLPDSEGLRIYKDYINFEHIVEANK